MNLLLLEAHQFQSTTEAALSERQTQHIQRVLKAGNGSRLKVGVVDGKLGSGCLHQTDGGCQLTDIQLDSTPPAPLPLSLVLALPRPQMIKRILQTAACMGVARVHLLQTAKVEKSFWQSPAVTDSAIREQLILGLEQAGATQLPQVEKHCRFRPFAEDILPGIAGGRTRLIAHPGDYPECPRLAKNEAAILAIGPEGGFTEGEVTYFLNAGFAAFQLGARILKVETAVPVTLAKLY
ncbi:16S rRNA (uracil(1498)-N(3))-methyltransferase [Teredinibacter turnerae]|uniref:16S rRNA (uracil(1498)-N(3))-methyltransferase n=1 Tax=Teredinibacter turnerae TaxID=2426 RepID=UPI00035C1B88|nr:16S rRNA (uracil(1498)-N(3))-methyltransferase [Teredinibacter turnerae]